MKTNIIVCCMVVASAFMTVSCGSNNGEKEAGAWLEKAKKLSEEEKYDAASAAIDSLREKYPMAIGARVKALELHQESELRRAKGIVEKTDAALQTVNAEYEKMKRDVEKLKADGKATAEQLTALTRMRIRRDSLQTVFDVQCAKIKYIKARLKPR